MGTFESAKRRAGILRAQRWVAGRSKAEKMGLAVLLCAAVLLLLYTVIEDHDSLFIMAETVHFLGIGVLAGTGETEKPFPRARRGLSRPRGPSVSLRA